MFQVTTLNTWGTPQDVKDSLKGVVTGGEEGQGGQGAKGEEGEGYLGGEGERCLGFLS